MDSCFGKITDASNSRGEGASSKEFSSTDFKDCKLKDINLMKQIEYQQNYIINPVRCYSYVESMTFSDNDISSEGNFHQDTINYDTNIPQNSTQSHKRFDNFQTDNSLPMENISTNYTGIKQDYQDIKVEPDIFSLSSLFSSENIKKEPMDSLEIELKNREVCENEMETYSGDNKSTKINSLKRRVTRVEDPRIDNDRLRKCNVCSKKFKHMIQLKLHSKVHMSRKKYECSHCNKFLRTKAKLISHELTHTYSRMFKCPVCSLCCTKRGTLNRHLLIRHKVRSFCCPCCLVDCKTKASLQAHIFINSKNRPHSCSLCGKHYMLKCSLKKHQHNHPTSFRCSLCGETFVKEV